MTQYWPITEFELCKNSKGQYFIDLTELYQELSYKMQKFVEFLD